MSHFRLVERLGQGGMGAVWRAVDSRLDREVALKILPLELGRDPERLARFEREAKTIAALDHPNIVTIHSVEQAGDVHFIAMELVRGKTLAQLCPADGLPLESFFRLGLPIVGAITAAHDRGVTHRDLKPQNIMVSTDGRVKVLDFGLAQMPEPEPPPETADLPTETLTHENHIPGTLPYMAPEQLQGKRLDARSDIFSLGVILYEMVAGRRPFTGETPADLLASILRDEPPPLRDLVPAAPRQLERIIRHSLEKDPQRRFQTARDLYNELEELQAELADEESAAAARSTSPTATAADLRALAVLPLDNLSGNPEQEFYADGMTDALITDLARIGALKVISRTSAMRYKGSRKPLGQIARELGVGAVVEGSVLRVGDRVRIMAQLIDASTDEHLWAERYERELQDVLALQAEVAQAIARQVQAKLTTQERERLASPRAVHPEAHEAYLRGRHFWHKRTPDAVKRGFEYFQRAIRLDPEYAPAYAGAADSYIVDGGRFLGVSPNEAYARARAAARKALEIDDGLAEAHTSLAAVLTDYDWDWDGAEKEYRRAIELNPSYVTAHSWLAEHLSRMGRHEEAIREAEKGQELDPLSLISNVIVAWILFFARRYDLAIEKSLATLELDPGYVAAHRILGWTYEEKGRYEDAIAAHRKAAELSGGSPSFKGQLGRPYALAGRTAEARTILDELLEQSRRTPISALDIAIIYTALGETDQAFDWLSRACDERSDHVPYLGVNPRLDPLRSDARFQLALERLGLAAN